MAGGSDTLNKMTEAGGSMRDGLLWEAEESKRMATAGFTADEIDIEFGHKPPTLAPGQQHLKEMEEAGALPEQMDQWQEEERARLHTSGFDQKEVDEVFGVKHPDMTGFHGLIKANAEKNALKKANEEGGIVVKDKTLSDQTEGMPGLPPEETAPGELPMEVADSFIDALESGLDISVTGLMKEAPDMELPENADWIYRTAHSAGMFLGDLPTIVIGGSLGTAFGTGLGAGLGTATLPVIGTVGGAAAGAVVGAGAGAFALTEGYRQMLMDHYEKGDITSFKELWTRSYDAFAATTKGGIVGGATAGVGGKVATTVSKVASPVVKTAAVTMSEIVTMSTVGAALEGELPNLQDFTDATILIGGLKLGMSGMRRAGKSKMASKLRNIYAKTGVRPEQVAEQARRDNVLMQDLLSDNIQIPEAYKVYAKGAAPKAELPLYSRMLRATSEKIEAGKVKKQKAKGLSDSEIDMLGMIGDTAGSKFPRTNAEAQAIAGRTFDTAYKNFVDRMNPVKLAKQELVGKAEIPPVEDPYLLARLSVDSKSKTRFTIEFGTLDYKTMKTTGPSLVKTMKPVKGDTSKINALVIAKRGLEIEKSGRVSGVNVESAKDVVAKSSKALDKVAQGMTNWANSNLKYAADAGIVSQKGFNAMVKEGAAYIPWNRIIENIDGSKGKKGSRGVRKLKGGTSKIQDPVEALMENAAELHQLAEVNRSRMALVELAKSKDGQTVISEVKGKSKAIKVLDAEMKKALKEQGFSPEAIDAVEALTIFRRTEARLQGTNQFEVMDKGVRRVFETTDPHLAEAMRNLGTNTQAQNLLFKMAKAYTTWKKIGITSTPEFRFTNLWRDQVTAPVFTKGGKIPIMGLISAMGDIIGKKEAWKQSLKSGAGQNAFLNLNETFLKSDMIDVIRKTDGMGAVWNGVKKPLELLNFTGELAENATRLAEFKAVTNGKTDINSLFKGGLAAREVTLDFQRMGAKVSSWNAITAFANVSIQGVDKTARALKENPGKVMTIGMATMTVPSILHWFAVKDDIRYQETPAWERYSFWVYPTDDWVPAEGHAGADSFHHSLRREGPNGPEINVGITRRVHKPQELGMIFATIPVIAMEAFFNDNPDAMDGFMESVGHLVTPGVYPDMVTPIVEQYNNKSNFTGRPLVPHHLEKIDAQYQYKPYTSQTAKLLGKMIHNKLPRMVSEFGPEDGQLQSPLVIENYIKSISGSWGKYLVQITDASLIKAGVVPDPVKPDDTAADSVFTRAWVSRNMNSGATSIQKFYKEFRRIEKKMNTHDFLVKGSEFTEAEAFRKETLISDITELQGVKQGLSSLATAVRNITVDPSMNKTEKRQIIDGLYMDMIMISREGNKILLDIKKDFKDEKLEE